MILGHGITILVYYIFCETQKPKIIVILGGNLIWFDIRYSYDIQIDSIQFLYQVQSTGISIYRDTIHTPR